VSDLYCESSVMSTDTASCLVDVSRGWCNRQRDSFVWDSVQTNLIEKLN
jgi:hypothetical protein